MPRIDIPAFSSPPRVALDELAGWRMELRGKIAAHLQKLDPSAPATLEFAISGMLESHYKPKELSALLGPSQTTISRWAIGQTIPRSAPYRKWLVETLIDHLQCGQRESGLEQDHSANPK